MTDEFDELEAEWADEMLRDAIISRLEQLQQLQREGLRSRKRRDEYEACLQLLARFPPAGSA